MSTSTTGDGDLRKRGGGGSKESDKKQTADANKAFCAQPDWSPYQNFSDYIAKLNLWIIQTQYRRHLNTLNNFQRLGPMSPAARVALVTSPVNTGGGNPNFEAGMIYFVPRIWKRVAAEVFDCILLFIFKIIITIVLSEMVEIRNLEDIETRLFETESGMQEMLDLTFEILVIAVIHRTIVCIYETIGLSRLGFGATPGKMIMGIKLVACNSIEKIDGNLVRVSPVGQISVLQSLVRSLIKNLSVMFFLPASLTIFGSRHNRTAYDVLCSCVVVETRRPTMVMVGAALAAAAARERR